METEEKQQNSEKQAGDQKGQQQATKESDIMALKSRHEKEIADINAKVAEATQKADAHYQNLLQEQAAKERLATELKGLKDEVEKLKVGSTEKEKMQKEIKTLQDQLLDVSMKRISQLHGIPADKLQGKTLAELNSIEEALKLVGRDARKFDVTGSGGEGSGPVNARQMIKAGFDERRK